ncbi:MAG: pyridine nucleotide-disulfide oxidoreductase [Microbacterium sp. 71-36]|uniref:NAD(P)/FAD-dependent oxidoreductase n=1 Tax=unclassified Microbacterium TaxID=2609290 RepID=UPI00086D9544|nr:MULTISPECIES: FAD-dependent oxidoreductase [unclassified Microbacterium]MBN9211183.1 FAD-dependent oxidoreductase [Microbacterium sp.]ODT41968.1 MAG: pyridine nucleotide-disulfide oxidoreductase [Microbacterium sp. SCN 71-17]OJV77761.1 MAG: pyridine nucleotide-disulfide oxidoreductase [Microbacterium sp. 71-36]
MPDSPTANPRIVVIGGGNAGLSIAGRLQRARLGDITVIEPRTTHIYAPLQSHIAGGTARASRAVRPQADVIPPGVRWLRDEVFTVDPAAHRVHLISGGHLDYDQLIVSAGLRLAWDAIPGLPEAMAAPEGVSNYDLALAAKASPALRDLRRGTVVFTQPPEPASCGAAAQKPLYLACDWWRSLGVLDDIRAILVLPDPVPFGIPDVDRELRRVLDAYGVEVRYSREVRSVDAGSRTLTIGHGDDEETLAYDVLHAVPPQRAPEWIAGSGLADPDDPHGFVDIDPETLRHRRFADVWSLGDAARVATRPSGGAIRPQAKVLARNLRAALRGGTPTARYDGYSVVPFTVSRGTVVFAEFDRWGRPRPTIPFWRSLSRERRSTWIADRRILPWVYWNLILRGRA